MLALTVADVRRWTEDRFYERGERYYRQDRIERPRCIDDGNDGDDGDASVTLRAMCQGSQPEPYRLRAELRDGAIASSDCSCPAPPRCKHLVALLLTWVNTPDAFEQTASLNQRLRTLSKDALIDLVGEMIRRDPALESLVDARTIELDALDAPAIRQYVHRTMEAAGRFWGGYDDSSPGFAPPGTSSLLELDELLDRGRQLLDDGRPGDTVTVACAVATAVVDRYDDTSDPEGVLLSVTANCADLLGDALPHIDDGESRVTVLRTLYDLARWNVHLGGVGVDGSAPEILLDRTTPAEREQVADWIRQDLDALASSGSPDRDRLGWTTSDLYDPTNWKRQALGELLLDLRGEALSDAAYLAICETAGLTLRRAQRLVERGDTEAAVEAAQAAESFELPDLLDRLVEAGAGDAARRLARERCQPGDAYRSLPVVRWLYDDAMERDAHEDALDAARTLFRSRPSTDTLALAQAAARPLDREAEVTTSLLDTLHDDHRYSTLAILAVHVGDRDRAVDAARTILDHDAQSWSDDAVLQVADFLREDRPDTAIDIYDRLARRCLSRRGRSNYRDAAEVLTHARDFLQDADRPDAWESLLDALHDDELHRLPAARDEFEKAGLL